MKTEDELRYNIKCLKQSINNNENRLKELEAELSKRETFSKGVLAHHVRVEYKEPQWVGAIREGNNYTMFYGAEKASVCEKMVYYLDRNAQAYSNLRIGLRNWVRNEKH